MPIYEFKCTDCRGEFEELVFGAAAINDVICPECGSPEVIKKISTIAARNTGSSSFSFHSSPSTCSPGGT